MPVLPTRCPVLEQRVNCLFDRKGAILDVFCPEFDSDARICRARSSLLERGVMSRFMARLEQVGIAGGPRICALL
jgi:hypothetical protein